MVNPIPRASRNPFARRFLCADCGGRFWRMHSLVFHQFEEVLLIQLEKYFSAMPKEPKTFHIDLPTDLSNEILKCKSDEEVEQVGAEWLLHQSRDLKKNGVPVLHYYTLGKPHIVANVVKQLC